MMRKKYFLYSLFFLTGISALFSSCSLFNPPEIIPCYGHIDSIPLIITNPSVQGTTASAINCAWVYVDDNPVGAFQLPCTFPMIATTGLHKVTIFAGIEDYGEAESRMKFPFYTSYVLGSVSLTQGAVTKFKPTTSYASWTDIALYENFDTPFIKIYRDSTINTDDTNMFPITTPNPNVYQGKGSGEVYLDATHQNYRGLTDTFNIPNNGNAVFLEMNYKATYPFTIGLNSLGYPYHAIIYVDTASTWKKMYINLQPTIGQFASFDNSYQVFFFMTIETSNPPPNAQFYLDNVKLDRYN
jgi:hypothetical protein